MKSFFYLFKSSANELKTVRCLSLTGILIAISAVLEFFSIQTPYTKVNFAFVALVIIGMLFGPVVCMISGGICDIIGFMVRPDGAFLPVFTVIAILQGLIYGIILYKNGELIDTGAKLKIKVGFVIRIIIARVLDVVIINIVLNTLCCAYYGYFPNSAVSTIMVTRIAKNAIELCVDLPILFVVLPICLTAYKRVFTRKVVNLK